MQPLLTHQKLQFKKELLKTGILLIIVAMDQLGYTSNEIKESRQDFASSSMMICFQFSIRTSWIAQSTAEVQLAAGSTGALFINFSPDLECVWIQQNCGCVLSKRIFSSFFFCFFLSSFLLLGDRVHSTRTFLAIFY